MEVVSTRNAPEAIGPYSQAIVVDDFVYTAGQIPLDPESMEMVDGGITEQTERVLRSLEAVLHAAGSRLARVVKTTVYLADMKDFSAMNEVYAKHFGDHMPARAAVQAAALPKGALVEIDAVAIRG